MPASRRVSSTRRSTFAGWRNRTVDPCSRLSELLARRVVRSPWFRITPLEGKRFSVQSRRHKGEIMTRRTRSMLAVLLVAAVAGSVAVAMAADQKDRDPFGVTVIRFKPGTSEQQMRDSIAAAGGTVLANISRIGAMSAVSSSSSFAAAIANDSRVIAAFPDKLVADVPGPDASGDAGAGAGSVSFGKGGGTTPPDPWHNATSFLGETNPEGILQWDDNRMDVPPAWSTTLGKGVKVAVIDSGVQGSHKELLPNYDNQRSENTI